MESMADSPLKAEEGGQQPRKQGYLVHLKGTSGFIGWEQPQDMHFHASALTGCVLESLQIGDELEFSVVGSDRAKPHAKKVVKLPHGTIQLPAKLPLLQGMVVRELSHDHRARAKEPNRASAQGSWGAAPKASEEPLGDMVGTLTCQLPSLQGRQGGQNGHAPNGTPSGGDQQPPGDPQQAPGAPQSQPMQLQQQHSLLNFTPHDLLDAKWVPRRKQFVSFVWHWHRPRQIRPAEPPKGWPGEAVPREEVRKRGFVSQLKLGYGFISVPGEPALTYFSHATEDSRELVVGTEVEFRPTLANGKSKEIATQLTVLPAGSVPSSTRLAERVLRARVKVLPTTKAKEGEEPQVQQGQLYYRDAQGMHHTAYYTQEQARDDVVLELEDDVDCAILVDHKGVRKLAEDIVVVERASLRREFGRIKELKGNFGFLEACERKLHDHLFHFSQLEGCTPAELAPGTDVEFTAQRDGNRWLAVRVKKAPQGSAVFEVLDECLSLGTVQTPASVRNSGTIKFWDADQKQDLIIYTFREVDAENCYLPKYKDKEPLSEGDVVTFRVATRPLAQKRAQETLPPAVARHVGRRAVYVSLVKCEGQVFSAFPDGYCQVTVEKLQSWNPAVSSSSPVSSLLQGTSGAASEGGKGRRRGPRGASGQSGQSGGSSVSGVAQPEGKEGEAGAEAGTEGELQGAGSLPAVQESAGQGSKGEGECGAQQENGAGASGGEVGKEANEKEGPQARGGRTQREKASAHLAGKDPAGQADHFVAQEKGSGECRPPVSSQQGGAVAESATTSATDASPPVVIPSPDQQPQQSELSAEEKPGLDACLKKVKRFLRQQAKEGKGRGNGGVGGQGPSGVKERDCVMYSVHFSAQSGGWRHRRMEVLTWAAHRMGKRPPGPAAPPGEVAGVMSPAIPIPQRKVFTNDAPKVAASPAQPTPLTPDGSAGFSPAACVGRMKQLQALLKEKSFNRTDSGTVLNPLAPAFVPGSV